MQENLMIVKEERLFLLRKLCQQQGEIDPSTMLPKTNVSHFNSPLNTEYCTPKKPVRKRSSIDGSGIEVLTFCHCVTLADFPIQLYKITDVKNKTKRYSKTTRKVVQLIPLDVNGRPIFPISLGDLTVYSLGEVVSDRISYHTEDLIYPVGYCSTRVYASLRDVRTKSLYTCKILDGGPKPR